MSFDRDPDQRDKPRFVRSYPRTASDWIIPIVAAVAVVVALTVALLLLAQ